MKGLKADLKVMKNILKDLSTAHYTPKTKKISCFYLIKQKCKKSNIHKLIYLHEVGHKYLDNIGYNKIFFILIKIWLWITLLYPLLIFIEEISAWIYAFKNIK
jgi:hypothetical protein